MIGKFILEQRKKLGLTQEFLASELSISRPTYVQIERGERDLTITEARKIAEIFSISLEEITDFNLKSTNPKFSKTPFNSLLGLSLEKKPLNLYFFFSIDEESIKAYPAVLAPKMTITKTAIHILLLFSFFSVSCFVFNLEIIFCCNVRNLMISEQS